MRRPYERGKVPVVLIHGLWGFPPLWDRMIEDLEADPAIRARYQFWTFRYASGDSIPFSAHLLRQSLRRARRVFDPDGTDAAFDQMVVVGHSLGGILAKMMVQKRIAPLADGLRAANRAGRRPARGLPAPAAGVLLRAHSRGAPGRFHRDASSRQPACLRPSSEGSVTALLPIKPLPHARETLLANNEPDLFAPDSGTSSRRASASSPPGTRSSWRFATWRSITRSAPIRSSRTSGTRPARRRRRDRPLLEFAPGLRRLRGADP